MPEQLKPCPFCGNENIEKYNSGVIEDSFMFCCHRCGAMVSFGTGAERDPQATKHWNRRVK